MVELISAFASDLIRPIPLGLAPREPNLLRTAFPLLDCRAQSAGRKERQIARFTRFVEELYPKPLPLKPNPLFAADDVVLLSGGIWLGNEPVLGTLHGRKLERAGAIAKRVEQVRQGSWEARAFPGTTALIRAPGAPNYFHWTVEMLPRLFALRAYAARETLDRILLIYDRAPRFILDSIACFFPDLAERVVIVESGVIRLERCLFFVNHADYEKTNTRFTACTALLSDAVDAMIGQAPPPQTGTALLISRADAPKRKLVNEDELLAGLRGFDLQPVTLAGRTVREQIALLSGARLVIGAHGAGLTNFMYCRPGTVAIEINSLQYKKRFRSFGDVAMYRGLRYALVLADEFGERRKVEGNQGNDIILSAEAIDRIGALASSLLTAPAAEDRMVA